MIHGWAHAEAGADTWATAVEAVREIAQNSDILETSEVQRPLIFPGPCLEVCNGKSSPAKFNVQVGDAIKVTSSTSLYVVYYYDLYIYRFRHYPYHRHHHHEAISNICCRFECGE